MTIQQDHTIHQDHIVQISSGVWESFLGMSLTQVAVLQQSEGHAANASVHIAGAWNGSVVLSCSGQLARRAAAAMFQTEADQLDDAEVGDAFGELANMIGGNVKSLLPEPSQLSLPAVSYGQSHCVTVPGAALVAQVAMDCEGERLNVTIWQRN